MTGLVRMLPPDSGRPRRSEMTATERVALVVYRLLDGAEMTTAEVAELAEMTWHGAEKLLDRASRTVPVFKDGQVWRLIPQDDNDGE